MASMETRVRQSSSRQEVLRVLGVTMERVARCPRRRTEPHRTLAASSSERKARDAR